MGKREDGQGDGRQDRNGRGLEGFNFIRLGEQVRGCFDLSFFFNGSV